MKRKWFGDRAHIDERKIEAKVKAKKELRDLLDTGDEEGLSLESKPSNQISRRRIWSG